MSFNQIGFTKGKRTSDHIFVLKAIIDNTLKRTISQVYAAFVDFQKAYDSVNRDLLFQKIYERGIQGPGGALGPNMYGCVPLRCCDFHPVWEHFPQFKYPRLGAKWQKTTPCVGAKDQENTM